MFSRIFREFPPQVYTSSWLQRQDVRRMADVNLHALAVRIRSNGNAERSDEIRRLIKRRRLVRLARALGVFEDDDAVAFLAIERLFVQMAAIIDRLAHPNAALVVDVHAGGIDEERLGGPEL